MGFIKSHRNSLIQKVLCQKLIWLGFLLLVFQPVSMEAQTDTLPEITVREFRFQQNGFSKNTSDSTLFGQSGNAANILFWENFAQIRANAPGVLATVSARGIGGSRTAVLWNGLNLQNPMNGVADLALLPIWPGDKIEVQPGGQSSNFGSGALGGSVLVSPQNFSGKANFFAEATASVGSFGESFFSGKIGHAGKVLKSEFRASNFSAENDFEFRNIYLLGKPTVRQTNNAAQRFDFQQFNEIPLNSRNVLETAFWHQKADREIPPSMTEAVSTAWQKDKSFRGNLNLKSAIGRKSLISSRLAMLDEAIFFNLADDVDSSRSRSLIFSEEFSTTFYRKTAFRAGVSANFLRANSDGYLDSVSNFHQNRAAAFASIFFPGRKINVSALARQEFLDGKNLPFTWSLGSVLLPGKKISGRWHFSKNYNVPTFNDRFWRGLGNPNLLPESGWSADIGLIVRQLCPRPFLRNLNFQTDFFSVLVDDWILWQPGSDGLFRPDNLRKVWSRGLETGVSGGEAFGKNRVSFSAKYQFTRTTTRLAYDGEPAILGKQLVYVPENSGSFSLKIERPKLVVAYFQNFTGRRFVLADNSDSVPGFSLGNLLMEYRIPLKDRKLCVFGRVGNVWGSDYQVIKFRAMPGRGFGFGLRWG